MTRILTIALILIAGLAASCQNNDKSDSYYFPVSKLEKESSYIYVDSKNRDTAIWTMKSEVKHGDTLLISSIKNNNVLAERLIERVHRGESKIVAYTLFNNNRAMTCIINDSLVYSTKQEIGQTITWKITFDDPLTGNTYSLTKSRKLNSMSENLKTFDDEMLMNIVGTEKSFKYSLKSTYKKGKGLISYTINRPNTDPVNFVLAEEK